MEDVIAGVKNHPKELMEKLEGIARKLRIKIIRMIFKAQSGHPGGSLSIADIVAVLYFHVMKLDPENPNWPERDRFILSKGHACPAWYASLALRGFFDDSILNHLREIDSSLQGHPDMRKTPGLDMTTGSLGNGLSAGIGMALAAKLDRKNYRVYILLGDGELNEGIVWEAALFARKYRLDNLLAIVDYNGLQLDGATEEVMPLEPLVKKWQAFGWHVLETDGHSIPQVLSAIENSWRIKNKPTVIIAHTIKGKGVSFMENEVDWHGKAPNKDEYQRALKDLGERLHENDFYA